MMDEITRLDLARESWRRQCERAEAERDRLREALTASAETKRAYIGEFFFYADTGFDENGDETCLRVMVPWTTIKEIMDAIKARAEKETPE